MFSFKPHNDIKPSPKSGFTLIELNVLFADGHVKSMKMTALLEPSTTPPTWSSTSDRAGLRYFTRAND